jgi:UTP--glucose-1-phosphate uridylyltransferase
MIKKAVIAVAGFGARRLPITRSIEKCMLPIGNRPVIDYVVQSCIDSGIQEIAFVVSPNSSQLQEYYSDNQRLQNFLQKISMIQWIN